LDELNTICMVSPLYLVSGSALMVHAQLRLGLGAVVKALGEEVDDGGKVGMHVALDHGVGCRLRRGKGGDGGEDGGEGGQVGHLKLRNARHLRQPEGADTAHVGALQLEAGAHLVLEGGRERKMSNWIIDDAEIRM
jgi:hypothetical protein